MAVRVPFFFSLIESQSKATLIPILPLLLGQRLPTFARIGPKFVKANGGLNGRSIALWPGRNKASPSGLDNGYSNAAQSEDNEWETFKRRWAISSNVSRSRKAMEGALASRHLGWTAFGHVTNGTE